MQQARTKEEIDRSALVLMLMRQIGLDSAAEVDAEGKLVSPREFYHALGVLYEHLGPEGLEELEIQSGVDVYGNKTRHKKEVQGGQEDEGTEED